MSNYQVIPPNHCCELTISLEEGLLLSANPLMRLIIECTMARAQALHPLIICHYVVEASHIHFFIMVRDPKDVIGFLERFKTESAHYINALLGRKKRTVWCEGAFCAPVLTLSSAKKKITYIYTNPAKDNLEDSIELFPGLTTWTAYNTGRHRKRCPRLHRPMIPHLPDKFYTEGTYRRHVRRLKSMASTSHTLTINPDAWMEFFGIEDLKERQLVNESIREMIKDSEQKFFDKRQEEGKTVIGRKALAAAHLNLEYIPNRTGKKMWCICDDKRLRIQYIKWAKSLKKKARKVYERWKRGDFSIKYPPGVFPPAVPKLANMTQVALY